MIAAVVITIGLGAFLRWCVIPCHAAYQLGKAVQRQRHDRGLS